MEPQTTKALCCCVVVESGGLCVTMVGGTLMPVWSAEHSASNQKVSMFPATHPHCHVPSLPRPLTATPPHCHALPPPCAGAVAVRGAFFGVGVGEVLVSDLECDGDEASLGDCVSFSGTRCFHFEDAGVICPPLEPLNCTTGDLRLVGGATDYEGRVEVCFHGRWGTVCDDAWDGYDATVVCRQLNLVGEGSSVAVSNALFGSGTGFISLDNVECTGSEATLLECSARDHGQHNCFSSEDAGVYCPCA